MSDPLLKMLGFDDLEYTDLTPSEKEVYEEWYQAFEVSGGITIDKLKEYMSKMKEGVSLELVDTKEDDPKNPVLKARLKNYMLLEAFLYTPEKAKQMIELNARNIKLRKGR